MNTNNEIQTMYGNPEDQANFIATHKDYNNFIELATRYFEDAGEDAMEEGLYEYFELDIYPFEEFQHGMPPADKLKYGGDFPQDPDYKVFYLNIKYANLADRLTAYLLLKRFNISFYPVYIQDNRHLRSLMVLNEPDSVVLNIMNQITNNEVSKAELNKIMATKRKQDHIPQEAYTWILDENEREILAFTSDNWVFFGEDYKYDVKVTSKLHGHENK